MMMMPFPQENNEIVCRLSVFMKARKFKKLFSRSCISVPSQFKSSFSTIGPSGIAMLYSCCLATDICVRIVLKNESFLSKNRLGPRNLCQLFNQDP